MATDSSPPPTPQRLRLLVGVSLVLVTAGVWVSLQGPGSQPIVAEVVRRVPANYSPGAGAGPNSPVFDGADAKRPQFPVALVEVAAGFSAITDIQFPPGSTTQMVVLEKGGRVVGVDLSSTRQHVLANLPVVTASEEGLLGLAFHPNFASNSKVYTNTVVEGSGGDETRVTEWVLGGGPDLLAGSLEQARVLLTQNQPYANHNGGQIQFGPDGYLYIGLGDGGSGGDPHEYGQAKDTWLGKILRIDVNASPTGAAYSIPEDNPFRGKPGYKPEIYAVGLRNPWRFSFDANGVLVVADVGQNKWEELDIVGPGTNLGWNHREGRRCFRGGECPTAGLTDPFYEYKRDEGTSITGGYVYTGSLMPDLQGQYIFGDFTSGRIWAVVLPSGDGATAPLPVPTSLGKRGILISTFGRDAAGEIYVADFAGGKVYRLGPPRSQPAPIPAPTSL